MLGTPQFGDVQTVSNYGIVGTASWGTAVPENATTLLDGAVTELISAANNNIGDCWAIEIMVWGTGASTVASQACVDILIGGATDDVLIESLICGSTHGGVPVTYWFPLHIPTGVRIAAKLASVRTAITDPRVAVTLYGGCPAPFRVGHKVVTYGTQIDNARGQAVTPTASGGTASVAEMTASTSMEHFAFQPGFQCSTDTTMAERSINIGIGVGASTEERIGTWWYLTSSTEQVFGRYPTLPAFRNVPAGSRLTMLASNSGTNDAAYDGLIYAVS